MQNKVLQNRLKRLERRANKDKTHFVFFGQPKRSELAGVLRDAMIDGVAETVANKED